MEQQPLQEQAFVRVALERLAGLGARLERAVGSAGLDPQLLAIGVAQRRGGTGERVAVHGLECRDALDERLASSDALVTRVACRHPLALAREVAWEVPGLCGRRLELRDLFFMSRLHGGDRVPDGSAQLLGEDGGGRAGDLEAARGVGERRAQAAALVDERPGARELA